MIFLEGLYLASASVRSAIFNLVPAITFVAATIVGSRQLFRFLHHLTNHRKRLYYIID
ncbi:hypothetical protein M8C21_000318 [Ambrosia artemisiifolia]|uniref:Uncharacterized protein n=1 Tax=Ambrosia artemisiifolia TaxID=4212 RepID=A0AAD5CC43_AMBAR|nr:hypothetical protein M8C21_000318 [Ambrosia artemisiifolia]